MTIDVELVLDARADLGEAPAWDAARASPDLGRHHGGLVHRFDPATGRDEAIDVGQPVGAAVAAATSGRLPLDRYGRELSQRVRRRTRHRGRAASTATVFVTTKLNKRWHGEAEARQAFANSAERLGLEPRLLLIHWPNPQQDRYVDAWRGSSSSSEDGKVRAIDVSIDSRRTARSRSTSSETGVLPRDASPARSDAQPSG